jgi:putative ABC transport system permease protein
VFVVTLVWSVLTFIDKQVTEKSENVKAIITEKWRIPSQMPYAYRTSLIEGAADSEDDVRPEDYMTWTFYFGSTEPDRSKMTFQNILFSFVTEPEKVISMLDDLDSLPPDQNAKLTADVEKLCNTRMGILLGQNFMNNLNKKVGDRFKVYSFNYKDIDLEFEVVGELPPGRYNSSAVFRRDYFNAAMEQYEREKGKKHPIADRTLNLVWLKVKNQADFATVADQISSSPLYSNPPVKIETSSAGIAAFLQAYRDILWALRWLLSPAQILWLVLGEALTIGLTAGLISASLTYYLINKQFGGVPFPIAFYSTFPIPPAAAAWGALVGAGTALVGSIVPAWSARTVKVSEVFSRVA